MDEARPLDEQARALDLVAGERGDHRPAAGCVATPIDAGWPRGPLHGPLFRYLLRELKQRASDLEAVREALLGDPSQAPDLGEPTRASRDAGWVLGVLAAAEGNDLLLSRREPRGFAILIEYVRALLRERGFEQALPMPPAGNLRMDAGDWPRPFAFANALFLAGQHGDGNPLEWSFASVDRLSSLHVARPAAPELVQFAAELGRAWPKMAFEQRNKGWTIHLPSITKDAP